MQKLRTSTQLYDDAHLLLTTEDIYRIYQAILSEPESGEHRIFTIQRGPEGGWIMDFDDTPEP